MTTLEHPTAADGRLAPLQLRPLRLRLLDASLAGTAAEAVDGSWWPYSRDLVTELEPLLRELATAGRVVHRVDYCLDAWRGVPRKALIAGTLVRLSGYRTQAASVLRLLEGSGRAPLVLRVGPPERAPATVGDAVSRTTPVAVPPARTCAVLVLR